MANLRPRPGSLGPEATWYRVAKFLEVGSSLGHWHTDHTLTRLPVPSLAGGDESSAQVISPLKALVSSLAHLRVLGGGAWARQDGTRGRQAGSWEYFLPELLCWGSFAWDRILLFLSH